MVPFISSVRPVHGVATAQEFARVACLIARRTIWQMISNPAEALQQSNRTTVVALMAGSTGWLTRVVHKDSITSELGFEP